jgi:hypothetical protein
LDELEKGLLRAGPTGRENFNAQQRGLRKLLTRASILPFLWDLGLVRTIRVSTITNQLVIDMPEKIGQSARRNSFAGGCLI